MPQEATIRKKVIAELKGWHCWYPSRSRFKKEIDIAGVWDLVCFKKNEVPRFIQLTTSSNISARKKKVLAFTDKVQPTVWSEIWGYRKKTKDFRIIKL